MDQMSTDYTSDISILNSENQSYHKNNQLKRTDSIRSIKIQQEKDFSAISTDYSIAWIFVFEDKIKQQHRLKMLDMYHQKNYTFNPLMKTYQQFKKKLSVLEDKNCKITIVADPQNSKKILENDFNNKNISKIIIFKPELQQFYRPNDHNYLCDLSEKLKEQNPELVEGIYNGNKDLNLILQNASGQIGSIQRNSRLLLNFQIMKDFSREKGIGEDFKTRLLRYRTRCYACSKLKLMDLEMGIKIFKKYYEKQIQSKYRMVDVSQNSEQNEQKRQKQSLFNNFKKFQQKIVRRYCRNQSEKNQITNKNEKLNSQIQKQSGILSGSNNKRKSNQLQIAQNQKKLTNLQKNRQELFLQTITNFYQDQNFFYKILNLSLRNFANKSFDWQGISVLYHFVQKAIKYLYDKDRLKYDQKIKEGLTLYRGGLISQNQLKKLRQEYQEQDQRQKQISEKGNSSKKRVSQNQNFNRQKKYSYKHSKICEKYVQFYGFLSTSSSLKIAADFACKSNQRNKNNHRAIFEIRMKVPDRQNIPNIELIDPGFIETVKKQQNEFIFNGLNVLKVIQVRDTTLKEITQNAKKKGINQQQLSFSQNIQQVQVKHIVLEYGTFQNIFKIQNLKLNIQPLQSKEKPHPQEKSLLSLVQNYGQFIFRMKQYPKMDIGQACYLLEQYFPSYIFYKQKLDYSKKRWGDVFTICQIDNIIYPLKLVKICQRIGKATQGFEYNQLSITYLEKNLQEQRQLQIYNSNNEIKDKMYKKSAQFIKDDTDFLKLNEFLVQRQDELSQFQKNAEENKDHSKKLKIQLSLAYYYFNLAITDFQLSELSSAINNFNKSLQYIHKILDFVNFKQIQQKTYSLDYYKENIFCSCVEPNNVSEPIKKSSQDNLPEQQAGQNQLSPKQKYFEKRRNIQIKQALKKYKDQNPQIFNLFQELQEAAIDFKMQIKYKWQSLEKEIGNNYEFKKFMENLNTNKLKTVQKNQLQQTSDEKPRYTITQKLIKNEVQQYKQPSKRDLLENSQTKKQQRGKEKLKQLQIKISQLNFLKRSSSKQLKNRVQINEKIISLLNLSIEQFTELGYLHSSHRILCLQNQISQEKIQNKNIGQAYTNIQQTIKNCSTIFGERYFHLATAYLFNAKLNLNNRYITSSFEDLKKSQEKLRKALVDQPYRNFSQEKGQQSNQKRKHYENVFEKNTHSIQLKILMAKAYTYVTNYHIQAKIKFEEIDRVIKQKKKGQYFQFLIEADYYEQKAKFMYLQNQKILGQDLHNHLLQKEKQIIYNFRKALQIRENILGKLNLSNALTYCQIIKSFINKQQFMSSFKNYKEIINTIMNSRQECYEVDLWKLYYTSFLLSFYDQKTKYAVKYMFKTIKSISKLNIADINNIYVPVINNFAQFTEKNEWCFNNIELLDIIVTRLKYNLLKYQQLAQNRQIHNGKQIFQKSQKYFNKFSKQLEQLIKMKQQSKKKAKKKILTEEELSQELKLNKNQSLVSIKISQSSQSEFVLKSSKKGTIEQKKVTIHEFQIKQKKKNNSTILEDLQQNIPTNEKYQEI